jgi:anti-anti-sigma factor
VLLDGAAGRYDYVTGEQQAVRMAICEATVARAGDRTRVSVIGEADLSYRDEFVAVLTGVIAEAPVGIEVDLAELGFIDSTCIAALMASMRAAREAGIGFFVSNPGGIVLRVLEVTGVLPILSKDASMFDGID